MEFRSEHGSHIKLIWNLNGQKLNKKVQILVSGGLSYIKKISNLAEKKNMMLKFSKLSSLATKIFNLKSV